MGNIATESGDADTGGIANSLPPFPSLLPFPPLLSHPTFSAPAAGRNEAPAKLPEALTAAATRLTPNHARAK